jgi:hypothetical protein
MSSSFIDLQLQAIDQCHRENKINDSEKAFLEEKWKEAQVSKVWTNGCCSDSSSIEFHRARGIKQRMTYFKVLTK